MPDPPARSGMSGLYANLLETSSSTSTSISRTPIAFQPSGSTDTSTSRPDAADPSFPASIASSAQKKLNAAALRFQPTITKRPQMANNKNSKPKIGMKPVSATSAAAAAAVGGVGATDTAAVPAPARPIVKTTLEDWTGDGEDDVNGFYATNKHSQARGGKKRRKKNKDTPPPPTNWDDIYEPSRPNSYEEYREGDEKIREMEDWRERVYGKRRRRGRDDSYDSEDDEGYKAGGARRFAPPSKYSFAPPPPQADAPPPPPPPPAPTVEVPDDASGEDAYARRMRMSQIGQVGYASITPQPTAPTLYPPPPQHPPEPTQYQPPPPPPPPPPPASISRAPVRYALPTALPTALPDTDTDTEDAPSEDTEEERSLRPGQAGFAHRLMSKYGWKPNTGLGADSTGIVQPLRMVAAKNKDSVGRGKIIDKNKRDNDVGKFGKMSEVVVLRGMVDGLQGEDEAVLLQEIGEECQTKYGMVERVVVDWGTGDLPGRTRVFVKFTSQLSALRAVNALEGRLFNGNTIGARYFDREKFESRNFS